MLAVHLTFLTMKIISVVILFITWTVDYSSGLEVIWAVNCGGDAHTDIHGIRYQKDMLAQGVASDYGKNMMINRVVQQDQIVYQTERYNTASFAYEVPIPGDGDYVLVLKFSEVWFTAPNQKVFDVTLNGEHTIVERLDIYGKVGRGTGHDEVVPFKVKDGKLFVNGESSDLYYNKVSVEFIKGDRDNPKVNGLVLIRGSTDEVPKLPPLPGMPQGPESKEEIEEEETGGEKGSKKKRPVSGPRTPDPYASDDTTSMLLPVLASIGAFLPILFCLCKL